MAHYNKGDIVYWISGKHEIKWGVVEDEFTDGVLVTTYTVKDYQTCNGERVQDMQFPTPWRQLPKGWTYKTKLFETGCSLARKEYDVATKFVRGDYDADKEMLRGLIIEGLIIPAYETMHFDNGHVEAEVEHGRYRLIYRHNKWTHEIAQRTFRWNELYDSYFDAEKVLANEIAECQRIANLSEYDYAVWDMYDRLNRWRTPNMTDEFIEKIKDWLMKLDHFEQYEFRGVSGGFQYRKIGNKKWLTVGVSEE